MQYKTLVLQLLRQRPMLHDYLRKTRLLLKTLEIQATDLKASHEHWKIVLSEKRPESAAIQIASEALELAVKELEDSLPTEFPATDNEPITLDRVMAYLRRLTPPV